MNFIKRKYYVIFTILFGMSFKAMIAWIVAGLPWDMIHGVSNFFSGILIVPIVNVLLRLENNEYRN